MWYPGDVERFDHASVGELRGMKGDAWEGGHRVPFLVRWPRRVPRGAVCGELLCQTDLLATLAAIVGAQLPHDAAEDSLDFSPVLFGRSLLRPVRPFAILKQNASVVRAGSWKLITHLGSGGFSSPRRVEADEGGPGGQLYRLSVDPDEQDNRWSEEPEVVARLQELLARGASRVTDGAGPQDPLTGCRSRRLDPRIRS